MKSSSYKISLLLLLQGCSTIPPKEVIPNGVIQFIAEMTEQTKKEVLSELTGQNYQKAFSYPTLDTFTHQAYRFIWAPTPWGFYSYTIEQIASDKYLLTTTIDKQYGGLPLKSIPGVTWKTIYINDLLQGRTIRTDVGEARKIVSKKSWYRFTDLLNGSYYWAYKNPDRDSFGCEFGNWIIESKSIQPGSGDITLKYHRVRLCSPYEGSFTNACMYLASLSGIGDPKRD